MECDDGRQQTFGACRGSNQLEANLDQGRLDRWSGRLVVVGIFYAEVADRTGDRIATVYREAFPCLIYTTGPCAIVAAIAEFGGYPAYRPFLMWIAVGLFVAGAVVPAARAKRD
jgi:hypothetical protein